MVESGMMFRGIRFVLLGFCPIDENTIQLRSKLESGGGVDVGQYTQTCTHLIVYNMVYDDPICVAARSNGKVVVTGSWVHHSFDFGMLVDPDLVLYRPVKDLNGIPGFQTLVVCLTGYQRQEREDIMTMVHMMGGQFSKPLVSNLVTHIICYKFEGQKYELAKRIKRIKIVNHRWLEDCLKNWKLLPEADYELSGYELEMTEASAKDSEDGAEDARANNSPLALRVPDVAAVEMSKSGGKDIQIIEPIGPRESSSFGNTSKENRHLESMVSTDAVAAQQNSYHRASSHKQLRPGSPKENLRLNDQTESGEVGQTSTASVFSTNLLGSTEVAMEDAITTTENIIFKCTRDEILERSSTEPMVGNVLLPEPRLGSPKQNLRAVPSTGDHTKGRDDAHKLGVSDSVTRLFNSNVVPMEADIRTPKNMTSKSALDEVPEGSVTDPVMKRCRASPGSGLIGMKDLREIGLPKKVSSPRKSLGTHGKKENPINQKGSIYMSKPTAKEEHTGCLIKGKVSAPVTDNGIQKGISSSVLNIEAVPEMEKHIESETKDLKGLHSADNKSYPSEGRDHLIVNQDKLQAKTSEEANVEVEIIMFEPELNDVPTRDPSDGALQLEFDENKSKCKREAIVAKNSFEEGNKDSTTARVERSCVKKTEKSRKEHGAKAKDTVTKDIGDNSTEEKENITLQNKSGKVSCGGDQRPVAGEALAIEEAVTKDPSDAAVQLEVDKKKGKRRKEATVEEKRLLSGKKGSSSTVEFGKLSVKKTKNAKSEDHTKANDTLMKDVGINSAEVKENVGVIKKSVGVSSDGAQGPEGSLKDLSNAAMQLEVDKNKRKHRKESTLESSLPSRKKGSSSTVEVGKSSVKKTKKSEKERGTKATDTVTKDIGDNSKDEKENIAVCVKSGKVGSGGNQSLVSGKPLARKETAKLAKAGTKVDKESNQLSSKPVASRKAIQDQEHEPKIFTVSGPRPQRKEYLQIIRRLKGKCCRDSHQWSYQATHFIATEIRRTEKFFAAAASGSWILKTDYVADSLEAGKLLPEEPYEWHSTGLSVDGVINLESPKKWRLVREQTGHGALYGMRIVIYGDCNFPSLDTLKRAVKAGDGTILATAPPYTRFLNQNTDFALISSGIPHVDVWIHEFIRHEIPCVLSDYLVEYVCKPGYSLDKHVLYNTHTWAERSFNKLQRSATEKVVCGEEEEAVSSPDVINDVACEVCGSREREEVMLICGDEEGLSGCGIGTHIDCCDPPLKHVPEHDWFCSRCNVKPSNKRKKGDFNEILGNGKKLGGPLRGESSFLDFRSMVTNCDD